MRATWIGVMVAAGARTAVARDGAAKGDDANDERFDFAPLGLGLNFGM